MKHTITANRPTPRATRSKNWPSTKPMNAPTPIEPPTSQAMPPIAAVTFSPSPITALAIDDAAPYEMITARSATTISVRMPAWCRAPRTANVAHDPEQRPHDLEVELGAGLEPDDGGGDPADQLELRGEIGVDQAEELGADHDAGGDVAN